MNIRLPIAVVVCLAAACSRSGGDPRFSADEAESLARRFHQALEEGDAATLARLTKAPFFYKEIARTWPDAAAVQANLAKEVPRIRHLARGLDRTEVFSIEDLRAGRWPRGRGVKEADREAEIAKLGLERDGWLARVFSEGKPGYVIVMNREGRDLLVQMFDI